MGSLTNADLGTGRSADRHVDEQVASALRQLIGDRNVRRYLCLHHPEDLHRAQHALEAWDAEHRRHHTELG